MHVALLIIDTRLTTAGQRQHGPCPEGYALEPEVSGQLEDALVDLI